MATKESLFSKVTNELLETVDRMANVVDEGLSILMAGESGGGGGEESQSSHSPPPADHADSYDEEFYMSPEEMMDSSPLEGIAESVIGDLMSSQVGPQTPLEHVQAFCAAIRWTEPFVLYIIAFQVTMLILVIWASRPSRGVTARVGTLLAMGILVRSAEYLNSLGAQHWESFATQNYFDRNGIFVGIFFCAPLLVDCFFMLFMFLREAANLLVEVKKAELHKKKKKKTGENKKKKESKKEK